MSDLRDGRMDTEAIGRGQEQVTFVVDPRFLETARTRTVGLKQSWGCVLRVSGRWLGQIVVTGPSGQARAAAQEVYLGTGPCLEAFAFAFDCRPAAVDSSASRLQTRC